MTFLFTDVVGSTDLWERQPNAMRDALARHDALLRAAVDEHAGYVFSTGGDRRRYLRSPDGIPLAIEFAAARAWALTPSDILDRLDDRFRLLRSSGRGGHERDQTLLAAVTWSVDLLTLGERCLFERLSVFAGTFTLSDAEAIRGTDPLDPIDVVDLLGSLVDRSMVIAETDH